MSGKISTIILNNLLELWKSEPNIFNALPELDFVPPLAQKIKAKGCTCGLGGEIQAATEKFNEVVTNLNEEQVARFKILLKQDQLFFGIQTRGGFEVRNY